MTNVIDRVGLYRVWIPLHNDGQAPLISIWIDPRMTVSERDREASVTFPESGEDEITEEIEDSRLRSHQIEPTVR